MGIHVSVYIDRETQKMGVLRSLDPQASLHLRSLDPNAGLQDSKDVFVLGSIEDITVALEDSLVTISTIVTWQDTVCAFCSSHFCLSPFEVLRRSKTIHNGVDFRTTAHSPKIFVTNFNFDILYLSEVNESLAFASSHAALSKLSEE